MDTLKYKINNLNRMLGIVLDGFDAINFETFDVIFPKIVDEMNQAYELRDSLLKEYGYKKLKIFDLELTKKAKLINIKFDNTLGVFSKEEKRLEREISASSAKRKIVKYLRNKSEHKIYL